MAELIDKPKVSVRPLLVERDFCDSQTYANYLNSDMIKPFVRFNLAPESFELNPTVESIDLVLSKSRWDAEIECRCDPMLLFQKRFWENHCAASGLSFSNHTDYDELLLRVETRGKAYRHGVRIIVPIGSRFSQYAPRIWDQYCRFTGNCKISQGDFFIWLNRLNVLVHDVLENPINKDEGWQKRLKLLRVLVKDEFSSVFEFIDRDAWTRFLKDGKITRNNVHKYRLLDLRWLMNEFFRQFPACNDPVANFLRSCYESFGNYLEVNKILKRCENCGDYMIYRSNKFYCSRIVEDKNCGKSVWNKRDYKTHRDNRRPKSREQVKNPSKMKSNQTGK